MNYREIVNFIMIRLGNRQNLKGRIESELEYVKEFILERDSTSGKMWFLLTTPQNLATVAGQAYVDLPADFNFEYESKACLTLPDGVTPVLKDDYDIRVARSREVVSDGTATLPSGQYPTHYAVVGSRVYLFPTPTEAINLQFRYYQTTGSLADEDATNPWVQNAADLLLNTTGSRVALGIQHMDQAQIFLGAATEARNRIIGVHEERALTNHDGIPE